MPVRQASLAAAVSIACMSAASAHDTAWFDGSLGSLPTEQCWSFVQQNAVAVPTMVDGAAQLGPTQFNGLSYWRRDLTPFFAADGASVTVQASVITSSYIQSGTLRRCGFAITLTDADGRWARLGVAHDRVMLQTSSGGWGDQVKSYPVGTAQHTFRLEFVDNQVMVFVDGIATFSATAGINGSSPNTVLLGDTTTWGHSNTMTSLVLIQTVPICGGPDLNCDGAVDATDMSLLLANWGDPACSSDLDGDGLTGSGDLAVLLSAWTN